MIFVRSPVRSEKTGGAGRRSPKSLSVGALLSVRLAPGEADERNTGRNTGSVIGSPKSSTSLLLHIIDTSEWAAEERETRGACRNRPQAPAPVSGAHNDLDGVVGLSWRLVVEVKSVVEVADVDADVDCVLARTGAVVPSGGTAPVVAAEPLRKRARVLPVAPPVVAPGVVALPKRPAAPLVTGLRPAFAPGATSSSRAGVAPLGRTVPTMGREIRGSHGTPRTLRAAATV
jgi:hypothetical protein